MAEEARQQAVTGHDEEDTALAEAHDQENRREAADSADRYGSGTPMITDELQSIGNGSGRRLELQVRDHAGQDSRYGDVQDRADDQR